LGLFEVANGGTLFLDEIGELPKAMQAKLLRFLESGEIRRVGENASFTCDVRVLCATHRQLDAMVAEGDFREDLWFRINTFEIRLPPLRERIEDVPILARHLARRFNPGLRPEDEVLAPDALALLSGHAWPGNVRELANCIEHAMILCERLPISAEHLPMRLNAPPMRSVGTSAPPTRSVGTSATGWAPSAGSPVGWASPTGVAQAVGEAHPAADAGAAGSPCRPLRFSAVPAAAVRTLRDLEMQAIYEALDRCGGNKPQAAAELGISLKTLYNKLNQASAVHKSA